MDSDIDFLRNLGSRMLDKIRQIIILLILIHSIPLLAKSISIETAKNVAQKWYLRFSNETEVTVKIKEIYSNKSNGHSCFYTFVFEKGGWVIISADDVVEPILGYSFSSSFLKEKIHPALKCLLEKYEALIDYATSNELRIEEAKDKWWRILNNDFSDYEGNNKIEPLLRTKWHQIYPYNLYCPLDGGSRSVAGCGATAMAQVIKYHNYPPKGQGSVTYTSLVSNPPATLSVDFDSTYRWKNMPNSLIGAKTEQIKEVARLIYHVGVSVHMNYTRIGSGNPLVGIPVILAKYFKYAETAVMEEKDSYSGNWDNLLKTELDNKRPILYFGIEDPTWAGYHAFVIDGYDSAGKYHINWGWNGSGDGYYALTSLKVGNMDFTKDQTAIVGITPASALKCEITQPENNLTFTAGQNIIIKATANDSEPVTKIELFIDEKLVNTGLALPYHYSWNTKGVFTGNHVIKVKAINSEGLTKSDLRTVNISNDSNSIILFEENFDGNVFPPTDWDTLTNNLSYTWEKGNPEDFAFAPNFNIYNLKNTSSALCNYYWENQDEWLLSPEINTTGISNIYLTFFAAFGRFYFGYFSYKLHISTDNGLTWTQLWSAENDIYPTDFWMWRPVAIDISNYAGQKIKLAWQCTGSSESVDGDLAGLDDVRLITGSLTNIDISSKQLPQKVCLYQNYPNPFNSETTLNYCLKNGFDDVVNISIYNINGELVKNLVNHRQKAGHYHIKFDGSELTNGIYLFKLSTKDFIEVKKMTLVK